MKRLTQSMTRRLLFGSLLVLSLATVMVIVIGDLFVDEMKTHYAESLHELPQEAFVKLLELRGQKMELEARAITRDKYIRKIIEKDQRDVLRTVAMPTYRRLSAMGLVSDIHLTDKRGQLIFSAADPRMGFLAAQHARRAIDTRQVIRGIIRDLDDRPRYLLAIPLFEKRGRISGSVVFIDTLNQMMASMSSMMGGSAYLFDVFNRLVAAEKVGETSDTAVKMAHERGEALLQSGDQSFALLNIDLQGTDGKKAGSLVLLSDQSPIRAIESEHVQLYAPVLIGGLALAVFALYWVGAREHKRITQAQRQQIAALERMNLEREAMHADLQKTHDELLHEVAQRKALEIHTLRLSRAVEQSPNSVVLTDVQGNIEYVNPRFCEVTGYSQDEVLGLNPRVLKSGLTPTVVYEELWQTLMDGGQWRGELCNKRKNGEFYWELAAISAVRNAQGKSIGFLAVKEDITQRKQAEQQLKREKEEQQKLIKKLEEAHNQLLQSEKLASIGQLAAGVAHEINNPVGYVNSNLNSLADYVADILSILDSYKALEQGGDIDYPALVEMLKQQREQMDIDFVSEDILALLAESREGLGRVKKIVQDLKDFSHVDRGEWEEADIQKGLESTINVVWNQLKYHTELVREYAEQLPPVRCMPSQLNQVFMNLLVNAAHAIEDRGIITVRTGSDEENVWVEVEDTGKGIEKEQLNRIFDPFFTTKPVGKGTGLGLSLSYSIIERHKGHIDVRSELGKGSCFRVTVPINLLPDDEAETESQSLMEGSA